MSERLTAKTVDCHLCRLRDTCTQIVDYQGAPDALLMVVTDPPNRGEDTLGIPGGGGPGQLLRGMLAAAGLPPNALFITPAVHCRPPNGRNPKPDESEACLPWLVDDIQAVHPLAILAAGRVAQGQVQRALQDVPEEERPVVFQCLSPGAVLRNNKRYREPFIKDVTRAVHWVMGAPDEEPEEEAPEDWTYRDFDPQTFMAWLWNTEGFANRQGTILHLDTETVPDPDGEYGPIMVSWQVSDGRTAWFCHHEDDPEASRFGLQQVLAWASLPGNRLGSHHRKYDQAVIEKADLTVPGNASWDCTLLMAYIAREPELGLKKVGPKYTGIDMIELKSLMGRGKTKRNFRQLLADPKYAEPSRLYAARDTLVGARYHPQAWAKLGERQRAYYRQVALPLLPVLLKMEQRGTRIDRVGITNLDATLTEEVSRLRDDLRDLGGPELLDAVTKPALMGPLLRDLGLPLSDLSPSGQLTVSKLTLLKAMEVVREEQLDTDTYLGAVIATYLRLRNTEKLRATYTTAILRRLDGADRIHTTFNQAGAEKDPFSGEADEAPVTSRLSSREPNLQNIPAHGRIAKTIRNLFVPRPGWIWVNGDYSQLELRLWADLVKALFMLQAFEDKRDIHQEVADQVKVLRDNAKTGMYATVYGADIQKITDTFKIPPAMVQEFLARVRRDMPELLQYREDIELELMHQGYIETLHGFRMEFPLFFSPVKREVQEAVRQAANGKIQGSGAGVVAELMIDMENNVAPQYGAELLLQVHDELCFEVPREAAAEFARAFAEAGARAGQQYLDVPLVLDVGMGDSWGEAKH